MVLKKSHKMTIGIATFAIIVLPLLLILVMLLFLGSIFFFAESQTMDGLEALLPIGMFSLIFPIQCITGILTLVLQGVYLYHLVKAPTGDNDILRIFLALGFFFMPYLAMPIYFFLFIWPDPSADLTTV